MSERARPLFPAALLGGLVGALLTLAALAIAGRAGLGEWIVRDALRKDPHILVEAADSLRARQFEPVIERAGLSLTTPFGSSWKGAAKPDVVLVEFFDYACGFCRASNPVLERLLAEDKGLRVVFRELPILGPASVEAARVSLAASKAGKFVQYHDALYAAGRPSPETIATAAKAAGIQPAPPAAAEFDAELKRNFQLAGQLGATGTPLFVVGNQVFNGAVGYATLKQAIDQARKEG